MTLKMTICLFSTLALVSACGLFISENPDTTCLHVGNSVALVEIDQGREHLSLAVFVDNDYPNTPGNRFAWLIPLPSATLYGNADDPVFNGLTRVSAPIYCNNNYNDGCDNPEPISYSYGEDQIAVLDYDPMAPSSRDTVYAESLAIINNWLTTRGFILTSTCRDLVEKYLQKGWRYFFIAIYSPGVYYGHVDADLEFSSSSAVIPMEISRANNFKYFSGYYYDDYAYHQIMTVYAYMIGQHKQTYETARLVYANCLTQSEVDNITSDYPKLGVKLINGDFITKLHINYDKPNQSIEDDITLINAPDDKEYRDIVTGNHYYYGVVDPFLLLIAFFLLKKKLRRGKTAIDHQLRRG